jgi:putative colanic acid biosynthesis glycosyltransferase
MQFEPKNIPLLSIITVCRNDAKRLKITIDSLSDFYNDVRFEHVVVDGESTDETDVLVASLLHRANFKFYSGRDTGIYDAMNRGVLYSGAPLLLFLNCGDTMIATPSELLAFLCGLVACDGLVDLDIACFPVQQIGARGVRTVVPTRLTQNKMPVSHQGMVFARRFVQLNKYEASYRIAGDFDLYLRAGRISIIADTAGKPLVGVEVEGVASTNPLKAYGEYLTIACSRLRGRSRIVAILLIGIRALCVITIKTIIPNRWVSALRGV